MVHKFNIIMKLKGEWKNKKVEKLKSRGRKGIPDSMRAIAWTALARPNTMIPANFNGNKQEFFMKCCKTKLNKDDV
jgi:hypothetical protein